MEKINGWLTTFFVYFIKLYQYFLSPFIGRYCRFHPTCSSYAIDAAIQHGFFRGIFLTFKRILSCHPWHPGGVDLVPKREKTC